MFNETYFILAVTCALIVYMVDYGFGKPGDDQYNNRALLFVWSYILAKRRLKKMMLWNDLNRQMRDRMLDTSSYAEKVRIHHSFIRVVFETARPFFSYEMILGMCPVCTHFWITLVSFAVVNIFYFSVNSFTFILYFCFSHFILRLIKRV